MLRSALVRLRPSGAVLALEGLPAGSSWTCLGAMRDSGPGDGSPTAHGQPVARHVRNASLEPPRRNVTGARAPEPHPRSSTHCPAPPERTSFAARQTSSTARARGPDAARRSADPEAPVRDLRREWESGALHVGLFPPERVRNFSIIAHVDHGKSTLSDRLLELTGALPAGQQAQFLDSLEVERSRGITVKANTASIVHRYDGQDYLLNLVDTPGHVDFSYEVARSLQACQGAVLVVDATQGVEAQTVANFYLAWGQNLAIVPAINKCDMPAAEPDTVRQDLQLSFDIAPESCVETSGKTGQGCRELLDRIVTGIPPATDGDAAAPLRALLFDAHHDRFRGVVCLLKAQDGVVERGARVRSHATNQEYEVQECGLLVPHRLPTDKIPTGLIGYAILGMKRAEEARVGDTLHGVPPPGSPLRAAAAAAEPLPGFQPAVPKVFAGVYPAASDELEGLKTAMSRLLLTDASVVAAKERSSALGLGFRCGFLGLLHMDVFLQRMRQEHGADVLLTPPTVPYRLVYKDGTERVVSNPVEFPCAPDGDAMPREVWEPMVSVTLVAPIEFMGDLIQLCQDRRGELQDQVVLGSGSSSRVLLKYWLPMAELAESLYDRVKSLTSGYATLDYEDAPERMADMQRLDLLVNGEPVDAFAKVVHRSDAQREGKRLCGKLAGVMERQLFEIAIQARCGSRILARETLKAYAKNVLAKCYGGDVSRKRKLLEKQKEGKKRMKRVGNVSIPTDAFISLLSR
ncbi:unnamed protein product [Pedinophyceae sp. YPF-701]|nr:unnamed protein product [Pedinophyceae sp. YPF-701]